MALWFNNTNVRAVECDGCGALVGYTMSNRPYVKRLCWVCQTAFTHQYDGVTKCDKDGNPIENELGEIAP